MSDVYFEEPAVRVFECDIARNQTELPAYYLPEVEGVLIAGEDMLCAAGYRPGSNRPRGWSRIDSHIFVRYFARDGVHSLRARRCGDFWAVERLRDRTIYALVFAFGPRPIWTRTFQAAIRLAEHCDPIPSAPVAGYWAEAYKRH